MTTSLLFENDVKTYSIQTVRDHLRYLCKFENDVKTYSIQTIICSILVP